MGAMKEIATEINEHGIEQISVTKSTIDRATLIYIDTLPNPGHVRIELNDGTIWDQDPEVDVPEVLDGFAVVEYGNAPMINCNRCGYDVATGCMSLRAYVAAAKLHECE